jgi:hypothetical protein
LSPASGQLALPGPASPGQETLVISASREVEPGARTMLLLAEGLFRLDVSLAGDALRTVVRNLSGAQLEVEEGDHGQGQPHLVFSAAPDYQPAQGRVRFSLGGGKDRVTVSAILGILRFQRGTVQVTGQAVIRRAPAG